MPHDLAKRWRLKPVDESTANRFAEELNLSPLIARILTLRGFTDNDATRCYLSSSLRSDLPSPFEMADMDCGGTSYRRCRAQPGTDRHLGRLRCRRHHRRLGVGVVLTRNRRPADLPCAASHRRGVRSQCRRAEAASRTRRQARRHRRLRHLECHRSSGGERLRSRSSSSSIITSRPTNCRRRWRW